YCQMAQENYRQPYPRPFPCGSLILGFNRHRVALLGHRLDISWGLCTVNLAVEGVPQQVQIFVEPAVDRVWLRTVDAAGNPVPSAFDRVRLLPDPEAGQDMPTYAVPEDTPANGLAFRQVLPYQEPDVYNAETGHPRDRAFCVAVSLQADLENRPHTDWYGRHRDMGPLERGINATEAFVVCVQLERGLATEVTPAFPAQPPVSEARFDAAARTAQAAWAAYWNRSGVRLGDQFLERIWYWNLYFLNCAVGEG